MSKFIIGTFAILAWAFYVMSGGAAFTPESRMIAEAAPAEDTAPKAAELTVASVSTSSAPAIAIKPAATKVTPAVATTTRIAKLEPTLASLSVPAGATASDTATVREVAARAVNMRKGPSTNYDVIDTLPRGTQTEVVDTDGSGWVRVRVQTTGQTGWMAERLLTAG